MKNITDYEWLTEMGLCHKCRKEKVAPGRKYCFDCLEKIREESARRYDPERAKKYQARRRELYREKKEKSICIRCNKKATHGMYCYEHYIEAHRKSSKRAEDAKRERHERGLIPEKRKANGLCRWCGEKAVGGTNVCERHRVMLVEAGRKGRQKDTEVDNFWKLKKAKNLSYT